MGTNNLVFLENLEWLSDELENEFKDPAARIPIDPRPEGEEAARG